MRLGILGGTFDPIHYAHLFIAEEARARFSLDHVLFVPNAVSPFKTVSEVSTGEDRYEMARLAIAGNPAFEVSRLEIDRPGPSYTVDTLRSLHDRNPRAELYFVTGTDAVADIEAWHEPQEVLRLARIIAAERSSHPFELIEPRLSAATRSRVEPMKGVLLDISATEMRERIRAGLPIRYLTPDAVVAYIEEHGLYR